MQELHNKFNVTRTDGTEIDPGARFFVLRLDAGHYTTAARTALRTFAIAVRPLNEQLSDDLIELLKEHPVAKQPDPHWRLPECRCPDCDEERRPVAARNGEEWSFEWKCACNQIVAGTSGTPDIKWPFLEKKAAADDFRGIGFEISGST